VLGANGTVQAPAPIAGQLTTTQSALGPGQPQSLLQAQLSGARPPPYGWELFSNSNVTASLNILDPGYIIQPGDHIALTVYGGLPDQTQDTVVDTKGNIVVPGVGPVKVAGLPAAAISGAVSKSAAAVYNKNVQVYATPSTTAPITVFVT
jgi:protein involved in polysaccharide export with SLBB domain